MKRIIVAFALILMSAGTAMAHGGVSFGISVGVPVYPYSYPAYTYPAPYGYYYSAPYGYYYPSPPVSYGYYPYFGGVVVHGGHGHGHYIYRGGGYHYGHYGHGNGHWHGR